MRLKMTPKMTWTLFLSQRETDHFEVSCEDVKLSDLFVGPIRKRSSEIGHRHLGQTTGRQMSQAKSAKMLVLQEMNYEEVKETPPRHYLIKKFML